MSNKWKISFITLVVVNTAVLVTIAYLIGIFSPQAIEYSQNRTSNDNIHFKITSSKTQLNDLISQHLAENNKGNKIKYHVVLGDELKLIGTITAFGKDVSLFMNFEPKVRRNGDLILVEKSIKIGRLHLPDRKVLQYIKDKYDFPEWIIVQPDRKEVYVALNSLRLKNNIKIKANTFDLLEDDISFDVSILP
jgi:uncharacterized protein YpmS